MGDIITCILHSKYIGHITHFLTKNKKRCFSCEQRAYALNILFPIRFWKFFFKTFDEKTKALREDMLKFGYVFYDEKDKQTKEENIVYEKTKFVSDEDIIPECVKFNGYFLSTKKQKEENNKIFVELTFEKLI